MKKTNIFLGVPVQVLNIQTKDLLVYNSKLSAAKAIGVSKSTIRRYIISKKLLFNKYLITQGTCPGIININNTPKYKKKRMKNKSYRIVSETTLNKMKVRKQSEKTKKISLLPSIPVQVFNVETKKVLVYNSKLSAARDIGISNSTISRYII